MKDIAERVGVSKMTVSAVLSGGKSKIGVSAATRARILEAAEQLQYRPNALARSLRSRRTNIVGLYSGYRTVDPRDPFMGEVVGGLQEACAEYRKDLLLHTVFRGDSVDDIYSALVDGRIDGLVMTAPPEDPLAERLAASHLPVVVIADAIPNLPSVTVDAAEGARLTLEHLRRKGHRRVVFRGTQWHVFNAEHRRAAYFDAAAACGIEMTDWLAPHPVDPTDPFLDHWRAQPAADRPTAVICWRDVAAYAFLRACHRQGVRVPEDLAVAGFDGAPNPLDAIFRLTTVRAPWAQVARMAIRLLAEQRDGREIPWATVLPVEFMPGDSA
jgi:LacI family transcriptional regulator